jgi:hypothetical protein
MGDVRGSWEINPELMPTMLWLVTVVERHRSFKLNDKLRQHSITVQFIDYAIPKGSRPLNPITYPPIQREQKHPHKHTW